MGWSAHRYRESISCFHRARALFRVNRNHRRDDSIETPRPGAGQLVMDSGQRDYRALVL